MRHALAVAAGLLLASCAIHPLVEDVTRLDTNAIVFHIRCEARTALKNATIDFLLNPDLVISEKTRRAAEDLRDGRLSFADFDPSKLDRTTGTFLLKYETAAIAYDFTFDMAEGNISGGSVDLLSPIANGTFGLGAAGMADRQRQTIRNFRVADTFGKLRTSTRCDGLRSRAVNFVYPISGEVGLNEVVKTFVDLNEFNNLTGEKTPVPVLADTFSFQTNLTGSISPSIVLGPLQRLSVSKVSLAFSATRKDTHRVIVAMSLDPKNWASLSIQSPGLLSVTPTYVSAGLSRAEERALLEVDRQKTINSLNNIALQAR